MSLMEKLSVKGILIGCVVDLVSSSVLGAIYGLGVAISLISKGVKPEEIEAKLQTQEVLITSLIIGLVCTVFGGFVTGWISPKSKVMNAAFEGAVLIPLGILFCFSLPLWYNIVSFSAVIPSALIGGLVANMIFREKRDDEVLEQ